MKNLFRELRMFVAELLLRCAVGISSKEHKHGYLLRSMVSDYVMTLLNGGTKAAGGWIDINLVKPPKDRAFVACVPGYNVDIACWDSERGGFIDYYHKQDVSGAIFYWQELPALPE